MTMLLASVFIAVFIGIASIYITKQDDEIVEEMTEEFIEAEIEKAFGLEKDSIQIDLTPKSDEKNAKP